MKMLHQHHIIPRHIGGTDDPENLIWLTIEEHAEAHRILYEQHGRNEDKWAWLGLSGQIGKDEIMILASKSRKGMKKPEGFGEKIRQARLGKRWSEKSKLKMRNAKLGKKATDETKEKIRQSQIGKKQPESQKIKVTAALSKRWLITEPSGNSFEVINLQSFCRENGLDQGNLSRGKHKGWKAIKLSI